MQLPAPFAQSPAEVARREPRPLAGSAQLVAAWMTQSNRAALIRQTSNSTVVARSHRPSKPRANFHVPPVKTQLLNRVALFQVRLHHPRKRNVARFRDRT